MAHRWVLAPLVLFFFGLHAEVAGRRLRISKVKTELAEGEAATKRGSVRGVDFGEEFADEYSSAMTPLSAGQVTDEFGAGYHDEMAASAPPSSPPWQVQQQPGQNPSATTAVQNYPVTGEYAARPPHSFVVIPSPSNTKGQEEGVQQTSLARLAEARNLRSIPAPEDASPESDVTDSAQLALSPPRPLGAAVEASNSSSSASDATGTEQQQADAKKKKKKAALIAAGKQVVAEFDLSDEQKSSGEDDDDDNTSGEVFDGERLTKEDIRRLAKKDGVTKVSPKPRSTKRIMTRRRQQVVVTRKMRAQELARNALQRRAASQGAVNFRATQTAKGASSGAHAADGTAPGAGKMKSQCMSYASFLKTQDIQGIELVRVWKGTCDPIVSSGEASPAYQLMCSSLGGAVEEFANQPGWDPGAVCDAVLRVFKEAGIGSMR